MQLSAFNYFEKKRADEAGRVVKFKQTYSSNETSWWPCCVAKPKAINLGPHQARAPATKATAVQAAVDMMKLLLL